MTLQIITVDDAAPGACSDAGITTDGTTVTNSKNWINTGTMTITEATTCSSTLSIAGNVVSNISLGAGYDLIGSSTSDIAINSNKFTVAGATGNTVVAGTAEFQSSVQRPVYNAPVDSGAVAADPTMRFITYTTNNTADLDVSLGAGVPGAEITIQLFADGGKNIVITPDVLWQYSTITLSDVGHYVTLLFHTNGWHIVGGDGTYTP